MKRNAESSSKPAAGQVAILLFFRLHPAPQANVNRFLGSRLGLLPWCYTYKEIRAQGSREKPPVWRTQGACSTNVTILRQKGRNSEAPPTPWTILSPEATGKNWGNSGGEGESLNSAREQGSDLFLDNPSPLLRVFPSFHLASIIFLSRPFYFLCCPSLMLLGIVFH